MKKGRIVAPPAAQLKQQQIMLHNFRDVQLTSLTSGESASMPSSVACEACLREVNGHATSFSSCAPIPFRQLLFGEFVARQGAGPRL